MIRKQTISQLLKFNYRKQQSAYVLKQEKINPTSAKYNLRRQYFIRENNCLKKIFLEQQINLRL